MAGPPQPVEPPNQSAPQQAPPGPWDASTSVTPPSGQQTSPTGVPFATPQSVGAVPSPPSVADSMTPPPNQPGPLKSLLTRFAYGAGQALLAQSGLKTDFDIQKEQFDQQISQQRENLLQQSQQYQQQLVTLPNGVSLPLSVAQKAYPAFFTAQGREQAAETTGQYGVQKANIAAGVGAAKYGYKIDPQTQQPVPRAYEDLSPVQQSISDLNDARATSEPQKIALAAAKLRNTIATGGASGDKRSDASYNYNNTQLNAIGKPIGDLVMRLGRLQDTLRIGNPQSDALVAPELLTVMAGGQGSGLRMNEAEISRIVGGRSKWQDLKASIQKWSLDPNAANSITDNQRTQIRALTSAVESHLLAKQGILDSARDQLATTTNVVNQRQIVNDARRQLAGVDSGPQSGGSQGVIFARDPQGQLHQAKPGTPLPKGWTIQSGGQ